MTEEKQKYVIYEDGNVVFVQTMTADEYTRLQTTQTLLHDYGFKYHGTMENEALFAVGAWRRTQNLLIILADGEPVMDDKNGILHPDPFNAPVDLVQAVWVLVYVNPRWDDEDDQDYIPDPGNCDAVMEMIAPTMPDGIRIAEDLIRFMDYSPEEHATLFALREGKAKVILS